MATGSQALCPSYAPGETSGIAGKKGALSTGGQGLGSARSYPLSRCVQHLTGSCPPPPTFVASAAGHGSSEGIPDSDLRTTRTDWPLATDLDGH